MSEKTPRQQTIQQLAQQLRQVERSRRRPGTDGDTRSTGIAALDRILPDSGLLPGTLVEWLNAGSGTGTLAFKVAASVLRQDAHCVVIDPPRTFYPPASGLDRMIVVHPADNRETLWAWEQSLRCCGVDTVIGWLDQLPNSIYRRLQLAAETSGTLGFLLRPAAYRSQPSWADVRLQVEPSPAKALDCGRLLTVELVHCRGRGGGEVLNLEVDDETGDVRLVPQLAAATNSIYSAGA